MVCTDLIFRQVLQLKFNIHDRFPKASSGGGIHNVVNFTVRKKRRRSYMSHQVLSKKCQIWQKMSQEMGILVL